MTFKKLETVGISSTGFLRMTKVGDMGGRLAENTMSQLSIPFPPTVRHVALQGCTIDNDKNSHYHCRPVTKYRFNDSNCNRSSQKKAQ